MKKLPLLIACVCVQFSVNADISSAASVTPDKRTHFYVASGLTFGGSLFFREVGLDPLESILFSALLVMSAGAVKELTDDTFSSPDMIANGAGVIAGGLGAAIVFQF